MKYGISQAEFDASINDMIANPNGLNQTYYTDFCGYYSFMRIWILQDTDSFKTFANALYTNGQVMVDTQNIQVTNEIANALIAGIQPANTGENKQTWGTLNNRLPNNTQMLLMLCLANQLSDMHIFHQLQPYNNAKHVENSGEWAGMTKKSEGKMFSLFGFDVTSYGNALVTPFTDDDKDVITNSANDNLPVVLLVNSYQLNLNSVNKYQTARPHSIDPLIDTVVGTHWITLLNYAPTQSTYWNYGEVNGNIYEGDIFKVIAAAIVVNEYNPPFIV